MNIKSKASYKLPPHLTSFIGGETEIAEKHLDESLEIAREIYTTLLILRIIVRLKEKMKQGPRVESLLSLVLSHLQCDEDGYEPADTLIARMRSELDEADYHATFEQDKLLDLTTIVQQLLTHAASSLPTASPPHGLTANEALPEPLTQRELEILGFIVEGYSNREIADRLVLAMSTVKWHINQIYSKLGVDSRTRAAARARALKLLV